MNKISHAEAVNAGLKRFFTGKKCCRGHISERHINSYSCVACTKENAIKFYYRHHDRLVKSRREWAKNNRAAILKSVYKYMDKNKFRWRVSRLWTTCLRHSSEENQILDFTQADVRKLLQEKLDNNEVILDRHSLRQASLDKIDRSKPIALDNIQIVPQWYNQAKWKYSDADLISAMEAYGFVRKDR